MGGGYLGRRKFAALDKRLVCCRLAEEGPQPGATTRGRIFLHQSFAIISE